jgi:hypothetical protein
MRHGLCKQLSSVEDAMKLARLVAVSAALLLSACGGSEEDVGPALPWAIGGKGDGLSLTTGAAYFSAEQVTAYALGTLKPAPLAASWKKAGLNAVILDVREGDGVIRFDVTQDGPFQTGLGALAASLTRNAAKKPAALDTLVQLFRGAGLRVILRLVLFKDHALVASDPTLAIQDAAGGAWGNVKQWVNPWSQEAGTYNIEVALRALASGAEEIQFDYIRFPDASTGTFANQRFPGQPAGAKRCQAVADFLKRARAAIKGYYPQARVSVDVFGYVANGTNVCDSLGQNMLMMAPHVDAIYPMQYPSHWVWKDHPAFGTAHPESLPITIYETTTNSLRRQLGSEGTRVEIIPWVQAFYLSYFGGLKLNDPKAGKLGTYVTDQIQGIVKASGEGFALWGAGSAHAEAVAAIGAAQQPQPAVPTP